MYTQAEPAVAGFGRRSAAFVLDLLLWLLLSLPLRLLLSLLGAFGVGGNPFFFHYTTADLLLAASFVLYFAGFSGSCGTTPGKRMLGMRIISIRTGRLGWFDAVYRETVGRFLNSLLLVGYLTALFDRKRRTIADRLCDTRVALIRQPVPDVPPCPAEGQDAGPAPEGSFSMLQPEGGPDGAP